MNRYYLLPKFCFDFYIRSESVKYLCAELVQLLCSFSLHYSSWFHLAYSSLNQKERNARVTDQQCKVECSINF